MEQETIENYIKVIYILGQDDYVKIEDYIKMLDKENISDEILDVVDLLIKKELIVRDDKGIKLTEKGLKLAKKIYQKHELFEDFLKYFLHYDKEKAHEESEKLEHYVSDEMATKLEQFMTSSRKRHGKKTVNPMHELNHLARHRGRRGWGPLLKRIFIANKITGKRIIPLTWLKPGEEGKVHEIHCGWRKTQRLTHLGLTKGTPVSVVRTSPFGGALEIFVRDTHYVLGHAIANKVMIEVEPNGERV
ncbi:MAG: metal-dependent transcriptional regulator [Candidatus Helarchaeota archaeon]